MSSDYSWSEKLVDTGCFKKKDWMLLPYFSASEAPSEKVEYNLKQPIPWQVWKCPRFNSLALYSLRNFKITPDEQKVFVSNIMS